MAALMAMATPDMVGLENPPSAALIQLAGAALCAANLPESRVRSALFQLG